MDIKDLGKSKRSRGFFLHDALYVARNIIGDYIIVKNRFSVLAGKIVEVESYPGRKDDASHSFSGKITSRNRILFEEGGVIYVYLIYGMYWCFNIVVSKRNDPQAVFIRALEPVLGIDRMMKNRKVKDMKLLTRGPCRFTSAFGINKRFLGKSLLSENTYVLRGHSKDFEIIKTKRIGINYADKSKDLPLRFYIKNNPFVSKK